MLVGKSAAASQLTVNEKSLQVSHTDTQEGQLDVDNSKGTLVPVKTNHNLHGQLDLIKTDNAE